MGTAIVVGTKSFDSQVEEIGLWGIELQHVHDLRALASFPNLKSLSLVSTKVDDVGLDHISRLPLLTDLCLQEALISNQGLSRLVRLPRLTVLRLKDNLQLTNACIPALLGLRCLENLQIQETSIDYGGLLQLESMQQLKDICLHVQGTNFSFEGLLALSARMPRCRILAKGRGEFLAGVFDGKW
jgi:Leucine-rich repeat (LRR) protein